MFFLEDILQLKMVMKLLKDEGKLLEVVCKKVGSYEKKIDISY